MNWDYADPSAGTHAWREQLEELRVEIAALGRGLDAEPFNWRPAPAAWSIGQNVDHLNTTNGKLLPALAATIARARTQGKTGDAPFAYDRLGRWFLRQVAPPVKRRVKAPKPYVPGARLDPVAVLGDYERLHGEILEVLDAAKGLHLARVKMRSPAFALLRLPLGIWLATIPAHGARHLLQARAVRDQAGFPRA